MLNLRVPAISCLALMVIHTFLVPQVCAEQPAVDIRQPNTLTDAEQQEGWQLLFDGKSAANWNSWKTKEPLELSKWTVEEGALTLSYGRSTRHGADISLVAG